MSTFWQRTLSGTVYVALVIASILVHPIFFGVLFLGITMLAVREQHVLLNSIPFTRIGSMLAGGLLFACAWLIHNVEIFSNEYTIVIVLSSLTLVYILLLMVLLLSELWLKAEDPIRNWGNILLSQIMIALPFALMNVVLGKSKFLLLALFITMWVNDTGAYCIGVLTAKRKNGNHKMFPRVSPKKSWEGLIGGFVFALLAGYIYYKVGWFDAWSYPLVKSLAFALLIALAGTFGDLMESLMKRTIGVKDSGRFMPGHGGVLDRFDSILLATPVVALLTLLL